MTNLEDVFLKINQEFAHDLFGDLKKFDDSRNSDDDSALLAKNQTGAKPIAHSEGATTISPTIDELSKMEDSQDSNQYEVDETEGQNLIRGSSCVRSCTASSAKRYIIYKRDWCGLLC